jgi:hypothetical protein
LIGGLFFATIIHVETILTIASVFSPAAGQIAETPFRLFGHYQGEIADCAVPDQR